MVVYKNLVNNKIKKDKDYTKNSLKYSWIS